mmetsp:Transcript_18497/g.53084  ORF Transcript_18497/g.53084 Transcript_18497/m.53084 type:complete len:270 (-) Transcript_18497:312-1121(-)
MRSIRQRFLQLLELNILLALAHNDLAGIAFLDQIVPITSIAQSPKSRFRQWQDIELIITNQTVGTLAQTQDEPLIESRHHITALLRAVSRMDVHAHAVQLLQTLDGAHEEYDQPATLDGFDGSGHEVGRQSLKVLEDEDADRGTQDAMRVAVVAPVDVGGGDEQFEVVGRLILVVTQGALGQASGLVALDLLHALHPMGGESQLLLVAPQDLGTGLDGRAGQQLVQIGHLILAMIPHQHQHGPLAGHDGPLDERPDAGVELLADHYYLP